MIFIDASFIIAIASKNDRWHKKAIQILPGIKKEERITSEFIVSEVITLVGGLYGGKAGVNIYNYIKDNHIIYKNDKLMDETLPNYLKYDGTLSIADSTTITIMKKLNIEKIVSFDSDFDKTEFVRIH